MSDTLQSLVRAVDRPTGLLVLLHGLGSDEKDLFGLTEFLDPKLVVVSLKAPHDYEFGGYKWFSLDVTGGQISYDIAEAKSSLDLIVQNVQDLQGKFQTARSNTILGGFSQGAMMSLAAVINQPDLVGSAWLMSGAVIPELVPKEIAVEEKLRVLVQHGSQDEVVAISRGRAICDLLKPVPNVECVFKEYSMAHNISMESLRDATGWLANSIG